MECTEVAPVGRPQCKIYPATLEELTIIVAAMPERLRFAVLLGAWCALRYGEVSDLQARSAYSGARAQSPSRGRRASSGGALNRGREWMRSALVADISEAIYSCMWRCLRLECQMERRP